METKNNKLNQERLARKMKTMQEISTMYNGKMQPQAVDLEEVILGVLLLHEESVLRIKSFIKPYDFYKETHRLIYSAILNLSSRKEPTDILAVTYELKKLGKLEEVGGVYYISQLTNRVATDTSLEYHARIVLEKSIRRGIIELSSNVAAKAYDDISDIFTTIEYYKEELRKLDSLLVTNEIIHTEDYLETAFDSIDNTSDDNIGKNFYPIDEPDFDKIVTISPNNITFVGGPAGCLSADTIIKVNRGKRNSSRKYTIEELYNKFHGKIWNDDNCIKNHISIWDSNIVSNTMSYDYSNQMLITNKIVDVVQSGFKDTFILKTDKGNFIRATKDHRFLIDKSNNFKKLEDLKVGDSVFIRFKEKAKGRNKRPYRREMITKLPFYPSAKEKWVTSNGIKYPFHRIKLTRAIYDANLNNVSLGTFIDNVRTNENHNYIFSDPKMTIHHIDENPHNDKIENLKLMTKQEHDKLHSTLKTALYFGDRDIIEDRIVSIEYYGNEMTYDIQMENPYNNFIANNIIVHNSGKTSRIASIMFKLLKRYPDIAIKWHSYEDHPQDLILSYISNCVFIDKKTLKGKTNIELDDNIKDTIKKLKNNIKPYDIEFQYKNQYLAEINEDFVSFCEKRPGKFCILIIDNIMLLKDQVTKTTALDKDDAIAMGVKHIFDDTKDFKRSIFCLHHYTKEYWDKDNIKVGYRTTMAKLKGSTRLTDVATQVLLLERCDVHPDLVTQYKGYEDVLKALFLIDTVKNRDGNLGVVRYFCNLTYTLFMEISLIK